MISLVDLRRNWWISNIKPSVQINTIELNPKKADAYFGRGISCLSIGQKDSGCLDFSKAGELGFPKAYDTIKDLCQ